MVMGIEKADVQILIGNTLIAEWYHDWTEVFNAEIAFFTLFISGKQHRNAKSVTDTNWKHPYKTLIACDALTGWVLRWNCLSKKFMRGNFGIHQQNQNANANACTYTTWEELYINTPAEWIHLFWVTLRWNCWSRKFALNPHQRNIKLDDVLLLPFSMCPNSGIGYQRLVCRCMLIYYAQGEDCLEMAFMDIFVSSLLVATRKSVNHRKTEIDAELDSNLPRITKIKWGRYFDVLQFATNNFFIHSQGENSSRIIDCLCDRPRRSAGITAKFGKCDSNVLEYELVGGEQNPRHLLRRVKPCILIGCWRAETEDMGKRVVIFGANSAGNVLPELRWGCLLQCFNMTIIRHRKQRVLYLYLYSVEKTRQSVNQCDSA